MIQRVLSAILGVLFLIAVFLFTSLLVAVVLTAGLLLWAWAWWRARGRRGRVIEGEYRVVRDKTYHLRP
jgi:VIT1/CCC1 family predicted Fe2+/Mn2+ transporter